MNKKNFNKGVLLTSLGSFWWGFFGVIYFKYISFAGHIEVLIHRSVWTTVVLIATTFLFSKWSIFIKIISDKKKLFILFISGFLIFINWGVWIYAVSQDKIIEASFGYFISINNYYDFSFSNPSLMPLLMLAGPMTVIPLFLYVRGV